MRKRTFLDLLAKATRVDRVRLDYTARALNAGGITPRAFGGAYAPAVTPREAAAFVLGVLGSGNPSKAGAAAARFADMPHDPRASRGEVPPEFGNVAAMTALDFVAHVIGADLAFAPTSVPGFFLEVDRNAKRVVAHHGERIDSQSRVVWRDWRATDRQEFFGIRVRAGLATVDLLELVVPFAKERETGRTWEHIAGGLLDG